MAVVQVLVAALAVVMIDCAAGSGERPNNKADDPLLDYLLHLQKEVTDDYGRLKPSVSSFPSAVFGLTDYDIKNGLTRQEITDLANLSCLKASLCKIEWFEFNWLAKEGSNKGYPLAEVKIRVYKTLIDRIVLPLLEGGERIQVNVSAAVEIQPALSSPRLPTGAADTLPYNTFSCLDKKWVQVATLDIGSESEEGWLELNLTAAVKSMWLANASSSLIQVALKLESLQKLPIELVNPAMMNVTEPLQKKQKLSKGPHLLLFMENEAKANHTESKDAHIMKRQSRQNRQKRSSSRGCTFMNYTVNFADLNLNQIIAPSTLNIGICSGECRFSFLSAYPGRGSNHASIMSRAFELVNTTKPAAGDGRSKEARLAPKNPCCVPDQFDVTLLLELEEQTGNDQNYPSDLAIKQYQNLAAITCRCM